MKSKAWRLANDSVPPQEVDVKGWWVLKVGLGLCGKDYCKKGIPKKFQDFIIQPFMMVATDREAAKAEISSKIDELFDVMEKT